MSSIEYVEVCTQEELDKALARENVVPLIKGDGLFRLYDSAQARLYDSAQARLYFSPRVRMAERYHGNATRYVACLVPLAEAVVIEWSIFGGGLPDKLKAARCAVVFECDRDGERLDASEAKAA